MGNPIKRRIELAGRWFGTIALALSAIAAPVAVTSVAHADAPAAPVEEAFYAEACIGETIYDPEAADGPVGNLLYVFGERLSAYNSGTVVPLYDSYGENEVLLAEFGGGYPPLCGVRYDSTSGGPVSEWMFCTDIFSLVCGGTLADGSLSNTFGTALPPMEDVAVNEKLDLETERMIVALINGTWPYQGTGAYSYYDETTARAEGSVMERIALQALIWCLTDAIDLDRATSEADRAVTCDDSMTPELREMLLAAAPEIPSFDLTATDPATNLTVGSDATFSLNTNILNRPIQLTLSGPATDLAVLSGSASLSGTILTVTGAGSVTLAATGTGAGEVTLDASVEAVKAEHLAWHQSRPTDPEPEKPCQVFATMFDAPQHLTDSAIASFVPAAVGPGPAPDTTTDKGPGNQIAVTGGPTPAIALGAAGVLLILGAVILVAKRKRRVK